MRILGIETATLTGGAALLDGERVIGESTLSVALTHSERLMAVIDRLLEDCRWQAGDLEAIAVSAGPGSFTGLRVGMATAKGLALALELPVVAVPTLDALAAGLPWADAPVCPVLDARKGEVYASCYRWRGGAAAREWEYLAVAPAELARRLPRPVILLGDGLAALAPHLGELGADARVAPPARRLPSAALVAQLGAVRLAAGPGDPADALVPIYVRPSEAELAAARG